MPIKPFLILQLRPETAASDSEYSAILEKSGLTPDEARRIRLDREPSLSRVDISDYSGIIVGGGPGCVSDSDADKSDVEKRIEDAVLGLMPAITEADKPFLGCCYGIGILGAHLGARVSKERYGEPVGAVDCTLTADGRDDPLLNGLDADFRAFVGHKEALQTLPDGCVHLIESLPCPYQMVRYGQHVYATQFHPEADAAGFELRINIYRDRGYFPAESAERLIETVRAERVRMPERILRNFVHRYRTD